DALVGGKGLCHSALIVVERCQISVGLRKGGMERQALCEHGLGFAPFLADPANVAQLIHRSGIIGPELERLPIALLRFRKIALMEEYIPQIQEAVGELGRPGRDFLKATQRLIDLMLLEVNDAQVAEGIDIAWLERHRSLTGFQGVVEIATSDL